MSKYFSENYLQNISNGNYLANYFLKTKNIIEKNNLNKVVTMNFFQWNNDVYVFGTEIIIDLLKSLKLFDKLQIEYIPDGEPIKSREPVLKIKGKYQDFGYLEGIIDSILNRMSNVFTCAKKILNISKDTPIIAMTDRRDIFFNQDFDSFALYKAGIKLFTTDAALKFCDPKKINIVGTMPHALIQMFKGDVVEASRYFLKTYPDSNLVSLIDFNNDCVSDAKKVILEFKNKLWGVRIDTSENLQDKYFDNLEVKEKGANHKLITAVRNILDENGGKHVKIILSSGINEEKINNYKMLNTPIDFYGIGSAFYKNEINFTGDCVNLNGVQIAKSGREELFSEKLVIAK